MRKLLSATSFMVSTVLLSGKAFAEEGNGYANPAASWEHLWNEVIIDITIIGVVMAVVAVWWLLKYKASSPDQMGTAKKLTTVQAITWALIPAALFMADDFFLAANGWTVWNDYRRVPENAMEIKVTASQWKFTYQYPVKDVDGDWVEVEGSSDPEYFNDPETFLMIPHNQPVVFRMTSDDVIHNLGLPVFRVKEDVMPGRITYIYINPVDITDTIVQCAEFCGQDHSQMSNKLRVVPQAEFDAWLADKVAG